jgi:hypothetical protein
MKAVNTRPKILFVTESSLSLQKLSRNMAHTMYHP